ncbi:MAG: family transcriptional regulator [Frankiales bacterium]|nr:family transcriptional regulator [Frankiales bacterium]
MSLRIPDPMVVVGLDNGGTTNNATVLDAFGVFLVDTLIETPSRVKEGPEVAVQALVEAFDNVLAVTGTPRERVSAVGFDSPGPSSAKGVISSRGSTNFQHVGWQSFDFRSALQHRLGIPVVYNNDTNAAALYAHHAHFGHDAPIKSSVSMIVGTGLGGGIVQEGTVVRGVSGMAGELGHVLIQLGGLLEADQPVPLCNCGQHGDAESFASLTGITMNLLPYWLSRYPGHPLNALPIDKAARAVRGLAVAGDELALKIFEQQAIAIGRVFGIAANFTDPDAYFIGGGVVEAEAHFRHWFLATVREHTRLREEQASAVQFAVVPDLDMAGARGAALGALASVTGQSINLSIRGPRTPVG